MTSDAAAGTSRRAPELAASLRAASAVAVAGAAYLALTLLFLRPIWSRWHTAIIPDRGDPLFLVYILKWGLHEAHRGVQGFWQGFWNAPFLFPTAGVTALSEHMLGPILLATVWSAVDPDPVAFFNLLVAASFVLCAAAACWVLRRSGRTPMAAFFGGAVFAFSHFRWEELGHAQILLAALVPLVLWSWDRLLAEPAPRRAAAFVALYAIDLSGSTYLAYMILFPLAGLLANRLLAAERGRLLARRSLAVLVPALAAAAALTAAIFLPYWREARALHLGRSLDEVRLYGTSLLSLATPSQRTILGWPFPWALRRPENALFAGFLPTGFALAAAIGLWRRHRARPAAALSPPRRLALAALLAAALAGFLGGEYATWAVTPLGRSLALPPHGYGKAAALFFLALGGWALLRRRWGGNWPLDLGSMDPWERGLLLAGAVCLVLSFPLVYSTLMNVVPGLGGMRVPARFAALFSFPIAHLAARGFEAAMADVAHVANIAGRFRRRAFAGLVVAVTLAELAPLPLTWQPVPADAAMPAAYAWIAARSDVRAVLELPMGDIFSEVAAMHRASRHWKPIVNGYSGYRPPQYLEIFRALGGGAFRPPAPPILARLRGWGVTHLLVRAAAYRRPEDLRALAAWEAAGGVEQVYLDPGAGDRVYLILPPASGGETGR